MKIKILCSAAIAAAAMASAPAQADILRYTASLDGLQETPAPVVTDAFGTATLLVDTDDQTVDFSLEVFNLALENLNDGLVANEALGPIHLHNNDRGLGGPIVVPFTFATGYEATDTGFTVNVTGVEYDAEFAGLSFADFVARLGVEGIYINVHSDQVGSGEIRGQLVPVPAPAAFGLLGLGLLGLGAARRLHG